MKLKQLEIIGFKSFMDKTVVTFEKNITAVVGPNGCGKSNIVDAIRWVMGEQSAKHLRGKQMEDVIFAGSDGHNPQSMAHVELTFTTDGFQTPAAYLNHPEISICRRLYRSGESEYFINKVPVRLRDITDLFLGTGIGKRAYSVIEQGRVSQVVTAKPEERRFYIEEVAGISRFKARKEAALRKMDATKQNLLRLTDVITELDRQMRSLNRQAKKAEKYRELKTEFVKWDLALSSVYYKDASQEQVALESHLRGFDEQEAALKARLLEGENHIEEFKLNFIETEREINQVQNDFFEITNYVRLTENTLNYKKEEKNKLLAQINHLEKEIEETRKEIKGLTNGALQISEQKLFADFEEESLRETVLQIQEEANRAQKNLDELEIIVEEARHRFHAIESRLTQIETLRLGYHQKQEDLNARIHNDVDENIGLQKKQDQIQKIYKETNDSLFSLKQLKFDLTSKTDEIENELLQSRERLKTSDLALQSLKEALTLRRSRLHSLRELQKNFEGYQEGTRSVLLKKNEIAEGGIFGTIADTIETEPKYEGAVSAVLGEKLQYVVVKTQQEGVEAVDYLRTQALGRSSFIPMQVRTRTYNETEMPVQEGIIGPLKKFVSLKQGYQDLSEFLFGDVVLVEDLKKALDVWNTNGHRKTLVTLNGEVVDSSGVITGGDQSGTSRALLEKKREMQELDELISQLETELKAKEEIKEELEAKVNIFETSLREVKSSSVEEEIKTANQAKDLDHLHQEAEAIKIKRDELVKRIEAENETLRAIQPELDSLESEEKNLREELEVKKLLLLENNEKKNALENNFSEKNESLTKRKIELAQAGERNTYLDTELTRLLNERFRLRMDCASQEQELMTTVGREELVQRESDHLEKVLGRKLTRHSELEKSLNEKRKNYEKLSLQIREKELRLKEMRALHDEANQKLNQVTVSLTEVRSKMKHLVEQCLERHQLNLPDIYKDYFDENLNIKEAEEKVYEFKEGLSKIGDVNTAALEEYEEIKGRFEFLNHQKGDLEASLISLERVIQKINRTTKERFVNTFHLVNEKFQMLFPKLFRGGKAKLVLTDENNILETGVEIIAQPPGKKLQSISLLSGGEKALTAVSLIFSIFQIKPSPFCLLDEVDAPLDDANVHRYNEMIREMTTRTQFVVITHNKHTMEMVDTLYGVTMQQAGVSQIVSVDMHYSYSRS